MLIRAKYEATTSRMTKMPRNDRVEPSGTTICNITPLVAVQPTTEAPEAKSSTVSSPEASLMTRLIIVKSDTPASQLVSAMLAQPEKREPPRTEA